MDHLSALCDFTICGQLDKIARVKDEFRFGLDYSFPFFAETAYRSKQGNIYTLETLVHYVNNHHIKHTEYIQNARTQGIPSVTFPDRKPLLNYLTVMGFFMRFEDDSVESAKIVKQWNVKIISIRKNKRHQDRAAALEVWYRLEEFVRSRSH